MGSNSLGDCIAGYRFTNVSVPRGATIVKGEFRMRAYSKYPENPTGFQSKLGLWDVDDAPAWYYDEYGSNHRRPYEAAQQMTSAYVNYVPNPPPGP